MTTLYLYLLNVQIFGNPRNQGDERGSVEKVSLKIRPPLLLAYNVHRSSSRVGKERSSLNLSFEMDVYFLKSILFTLVSVKLRSSKERID
jgi:hypothetical protein